MYIREKFLNNHNLLTKILYEYRRVLFIFIFFLVKLNIETGRKPYYKNIRSGNPFTMR